VFSRITERNSFRDKLSTLIPNRAAEALGSSYCCSPASGRPIGCRFAKDMEDASGSSSSPAVLRNKYWVLRHGRSVPNERGLIVSSLVRTSPSQQRSFFLRLRAPSIAYPKSQPNSLQPMLSWSVDGRRTARSRSSGWPRRGSSRRARPAKSSGRYRIVAPLLWILFAVVNLARVFFVLRVQELDEIGVPVGSVKIRYSPFSRTTETARVVAGVLGIPFEAPSCEVS
jgi:hypothetical protein